MAGLSALESTLIDWAIDQGFGTKVGNQVITVIQPLVTALDSGLTLKEALLSIAVTEVGTLVPKSTTLALALPVITKLVTELEAGETVETALKALIN